MAFILVLLLLMIVFASKAGSIAGVILAFVAGLWLIWYDDKHKKDQDNED